MDRTNDLIVLLSLWFLSVEVYRSPVETLCTNIDYYIPDDKGATKGFSEDAMARLRKSWTSLSSSNAHCN